MSNVLLVSDEPCVFCYSSGPSGYFLRRYRLRVMVKSGFSYGYWCLSDLHPLLFVFPSSFISIHFSKHPTGRILSCVVVTRRLATHTHRLFVLTLLYLLYFIYIL